jgi:hypothetical protein
MLFLLALSVACVAWTVTHEEIFSEWRGHCIARKRDASTVLRRKFYYVFTCEYCFSHWVALGVVLLSGYRVAGSWLLAVFALVAVANVYMSLYEGLRLTLKRWRG